MPAPSAFSATTLPMSLAASQLPPYLIWSRSSLSRVLADTSADDKVLGLARLAALDRVHAAARVNSHPPIAWPTWPRGLWPKIEALAQKVVRRLLRWYIDPIVEQQNRFNAAVAQVLDIYWREICSLQAQPPREKDE